MNHQVCEQIKRAVWNSGNGVVTGQTSWLTGRIEYEE